MNGADLRGKPREHWGTAGDASARLLHRISAAAQCWPAFAFSGGSTDFASSHQSLARSLRSPIGKWCQCGGTDGRDGKVAEEGPHAAAEALVGAVLAAGARCPLPRT